MSRITLLEVLRRYYSERGLEPDEAEREAQQFHAWVVPMSKGSADIHLNDHYFVALEQEGELHIDSRDLDAAVERLRESSKGFTHRIHDEQ